MFKYFIKYIDSYKNSYKLNSIKKKVNLINSIENKIEKLNNLNLFKKTDEFIDRLNNGENINSILIEAFAVVRESIKRIFGIRLFDVQLMGGIVLHNECIAEMLTGEGKTFTSTLAAYLNSLYKKGVHIITMNDYLAKRDSENNSSLFEFLGINVGINLHGMSFKEKKKSYLCDITYGTNHEYCFDYLRDNLIMDVNEKVQRNLHYAIIDEVDSILIDEARTPLIISSQDKNYSHLYIKINSLIKYLINEKEEFDIELKKKKYFIVDFKIKQINLTEEGFKLIEKLMVNLNFIKNGNLLYISENIILIHHVIISLKAHIFFKKNVDYIIKDKKIIIVDEHTGRMVKERRWSDGLHQAIEAKENLSIQNESQNLASITFQNYFRLYKKLSGMTGTAYTEKEELKYIYNLDTIKIPTNKPMIRIDFSDLVFLTEKEKIQAIISDVIKYSKKKQPVLIGTISIEKSELFSFELKKVGIKHKILNAKFNDIEAEIISQAGKPGSVTIATNMAGRGTDIILGGNLNNEIKKLKKKDSESIEKIKKIWKINNNIVLKSGGLHIIGTERHESRRIDNQLIGRSGRQGDPGSSRFYLSMEDQLIKIFISKKILNIINNLNIKFGESFEHSLINNYIENCQEKLENRNFYIRKQLMIYDDVSNDQRNIIYEIRNNFLFLKNLDSIISNIKKEIIKNTLLKFIPNNSKKNIWKFEELNKYLNNEFNFKDDFITIFLKKNINNENDKYIRNLIYESIKNEYKLIEKSINKKTLNLINKIIFLKKLDLNWKNHLCIMDDLRQGIFLRSYAQKDPKQEYKIESFYLFKNMIFTWKYESICYLNKLIFKNVLNNNINYNNLNLFELKNYLLNDLN